MTDDVSSGNGGSAPRGDSPPAGALHHVELYAADLATATPFWEWWLTTLGYESYQEWDGGQSWRRGPTYVVLAEADADGTFDRREPGLNHLAFHAASRTQVDAVTEGVRDRTDARVLYPDRHPFAGGEDYYALYAEGPEGVKVELVAPE